MNSYQEAEKITKRIDEHLDVDKPNGVARLEVLDNFDKIQYLNYLRAIRTHIELIERIIHKGI